MKKSLSVGDKIFLENSQENGPKEKKREKRGDRKKIWAEVQESIQKEEPNDSPEVPRQEEGQQCTSPGLPSGVPRFSLIRNILYTKRQELAANIQ